MIQKLKHLLGLDIKEDLYAYQVDPEYGPISQQKRPDHWIRTTCGYCSVGCGMKIGVRDNRLVAVKGDPDHPVNRGKLCPKGLSEHVPVSSPRRARQPLRRNNAGDFVALDWPDAARHFIQRFRDIQARHGRESIAVLSTGQLVTEEFYALGKLVQLGLRTRHYDGNTTLCMSSAVMGYKQSFGSDGPPGSYEGLATADVLFLIGANIADNHPILWHHIARNPRKTIIVCDPRKTKTAMQADLYLPIRPRRDLDLLNGLIHLVIRENRADRTFVEAHTEGFDELARHVAPYTPAVTAERTGLSEAAIYRTFEAITAAQNAMFAWTMGVNHSKQGTDTVSMINTLALVTGHIGRTGAAPLSITGQCNAMGSREFSFSSSLPGYRAFESPQDRADLARLWRIDEALIPRARGMNYPQIIDAVLDGSIKGLWVIATNPVVSFPDRRRLERAFEALDFLVVQDGFFPTPTTQYAHLVLPAAIWGEKDGSYTNSERRVSRVRAGVTPPGQAKPDFEIFMELAEHLGVKQSLFPGWQSPRDAFAEIRRISQGRLCDYSGITEERLDRSVQWPCNEQHPDGADSLYTDGVFPTANGRARLFCAHAEPLDEEPDSTYRLILNTGRTVEHWHTRTKTEHVPLLNKLAPRAWVEVNPRTARDYGITAADRVSLLSRRGRVDDLVVLVTETVAPGQVFMPFHFARQCANRLTLPCFDPKSGEPNYKQCAVTLRRYAPGAPGSA